jgi:cytosine/adenosine deaminase-related metal-dependent hydrolase
MPGLTTQCETATINSPSKSGELELVGGYVAFDADEAARAEIQIAGGRILNIVRVGQNQGGRSASYDVSRSVTTVDLSGYLILPGLVNAHDHLEFNLFPRLGRGPYPNAAIWAEDIHRSDGPAIRQHSAVPKPLRLLWGGIKNLLCGATTVCHHNPFDEEIFDSGFPVRVVKQFGWTHSLAFGEEIAAAFEATPYGAPFIIHLAEGTDASSREEIFALDELGFLDSRTVIVHGVGLGERGLNLLKQRGAALVWCPTSNHFTLGRTLDQRFASRVRRIALGNDSPLTAQGDLLNEINFVLKDAAMDPPQIYSSVTDGAAEVLRLKNGEGTLRGGALADFIVMKWQGRSPAESLTKATIDDIHAVVLGGQLNSVSPHFIPRWPRVLLDGLEPVVVEGTERWVRVGISDLLAATRLHLGDSIRLAGKHVTS